MTRGTLSMLKHICMFYQIIQLLFQHVVLILMMHLVCLLQNQNLKPKANIHKEVLKRRQYMEI